MPKKSSHQKTKTRKARRDKSRPKGYTLYSPPPRKGKKHSAEEKIALSVLNDAAEAGLVPLETLPFFMEYFYRRLSDEQRALDARGPDEFSGAQLVSVLTDAQDAVSSTIYTRVDDRIVLLSATTGETLYVSAINEKSGSDTDYGFYIELLAEILLLIVSAFGGPRGANVKKAAEETAKELAEKEAVRAALKKIWKALVADNPLGMPPPTAGESLGRILEALSELLEQLGSALRDFFGKVWDSMTNFGLLLLVLEVIVFFTPVGWFKRGAAFAAGLIGLTGSIVSKLESDPEPAPV